MVRVRGILILLLNWSYLWMEAAVVVERSNSFNSNIDWIAHGIERSSPRRAIRFRRLSYVNSINSIVREALRMRTSTFVNSLHIYVSIDSFSRMTTRERASIDIYISTDMSTDTHTYRSALTHTHTHRHTHYRYGNGLIAICHSSEDWSYSHIGPKGSFATYTIGLTETV